MINFYEAEIADITPENLLNAEVMAISFAIKNAMQRLQRQAASIPVFAAFDALPESVLDLMAVEERTQYYEQDLPLETKRKLVRQTYGWYLNAGTPSVINEFLASLHQGGWVEEWFQYEGNPYYFRVTILIGEDEILAGSQEVKRRILLYKNARSWLDTIIYQMQTSVEVEITLQARLTLRSDFFRGNVKLLYLDGSWMLNGVWSLSGYQSDYRVDFYPARLEGKSDVKCKIEYKTSTGWVVRVIQNVDGNSIFRLISDLIKSEEYSTGIRLSAELRSKYQWGEVFTLRSDIKGENEVDSFYSVKDFCMVRKAQDLTIKLFANVESVMAVDGKLTVKKNLWFLDGTYDLNGEKELNAEIIFYE